MKDFFNQLLSFLEIPHYQSNMMVSKHLAISGTFKTFILKFQVNLHIRKTTCYFTFIQPFVGKGKK